MTCYEALGLRAIAEKRLETVKEHEYTENVARVIYVSGDLSENRKPTMGLHIGYSSSMVGTSNPIDSII